MTIVPGHKLHPFSGNGGLLQEPFSPSLYGLHEPLQQAIPVPAAVKCGTECLIGETNRMCNENGGLVNETESGEDGTNPS